MTDIRLVRGVTQRMLRREQLRFAAAARWELSTWAPLTVQLARLAPLWQPTGLVRQDVPRRPVASPPSRPGVTSLGGRETLERLVGDVDEPNPECKGSYSLQPNRRELPWLRTVLPSMAKVRRSCVN